MRIYSEKTGGPIGSPATIEYSIWLERQAILKEKRSDYLYVNTMVISV
jgi:hypothetical protein